MQPTTRDFHDPVRREEVEESQQTTVRKAVILAAGVGDRLRPFTETFPKCLAPINGKPILVNALTHLADVGVSEVVIVVGHHKEKIYERIGDVFGGLKVSYVESKDYTSTNNIYSLWLAREHLVEDILLLEADVFFERRVLDRVLSFENESVAAVSQHQSWMSGTVVSVDREGRVQALMDARDQGPDFDYSKVYKTANIYLFRGDFLKRYFVPHLQAYIAAEDVDEYYEAILHAMAHRGKHNIHAVRCDDLKWYEIDDESDRLAAEYLFSSQEQRYDFIDRQHGGYWRHDFVDHAYLYNLYFPPEPVFAHFKNHLNDLVLHYPVGQNDLAQRIGTLLAQPKNRIVVGNGAAELIKVLAGQVRRRMIVPVPSFNEYENASAPERLERFLLEAPSFQLDLDAFAEQAARCEADMAVVVNPNNPTSLSTPRAGLLQLADRLAKQDCRLIIDESFIDFSADRASSTVAQQLDEHPNLAIIMSMSKSYGIGGLRVGYLLTADVEFAASVRKQVPIWNVNGFADAFLRLLPRYRREFARSCERVRTDRDALYRGLSAIPGVSVFEPSANFVMCRLPDGGPDGPEVARALFVQNNILIKHCAGKTMPESDRYVRIASRTTLENSELVKAMKSILKPHARPLG